jgi:drug/metabolite transporter (DMT)-like permease
MLTTDFFIPQRPEAVPWLTYWNHVIAMVRSVFRARSRPSMRLWGYGAFILISLLYASFYPVARPALDRIDTPIFVAMQMLWLVPPALVLLFWSRWQVRWQALLHSVVLGSGMSAALFCLTWAIAFTSITETALFSCMNGVIVVLLSWLVFRQRVHLLTWLACLCSVGGIVVLFSVSRMHWQGDLLAFLGGLLLTGYTFLIERWYFLPQAAQTPKPSLRAACGIEWLTMAGETLLVALLFGNWHAVHLLLPSDVLIFGYVGLVTTLLPMILMVTMRKYVNGVTLTFIAILEPIADACGAFFFVHEHFLAQVLFGGVLAIASVILQALTGCLRSPSFSPDGLPFRWILFRLFRQRAVHQAGDVQRRWGGMQTMPGGRRARALLAHLWEHPDGG